MHASDFEDLAALEATMWWFVGMRTIQETLLDPLLPNGPDRDILDIGCGTGGNMTWLARYRGGGTLAGIDVEQVAIDFSRQHHDRLIRASATALPCDASAFDLVTAFDVIQQLPRDEAGMALAEMRRVLRPGGIGLVRAAAYEWMRSAHDTALATQHRFTVGELAGLAEGAGLDIVRRTYANTVLLPVAMINRLLVARVAARRGRPEHSDVRPLPDALGWANRLLAGVLRGEAAAIRRLGLPFGLSAIIVVRKVERP